MDVRAPCVVAAMLSEATRRGCLGAGAYGQGGLVLNFTLEFFRFVNFKNAAIEANKGHLHCNIELRRVL